MPELAVPVRAIEVEMKVGISRVGLWVAALIFLLAGCGGEYREEEREIGYFGKARLDPFLASERFLERLGHDVRVDRSWPRVDDSIGVMILPVSMLEAKGYIEEVRRWVARGGHLVCLFSWTSPAKNDWNEFPESPPELSEPLKKWFEDAGWRVDLKKAKEARSWVIVRKSKKGKESEKPSEPAPETEDWVFDGRKFRTKIFGSPLFAPAAAETADENEALRRFVTGFYGNGRLTLVADARPFRNRYIGEADHAPLLAALVDASRAGRVVVVLGTDVSFWRLVWANGWTVLVALGALTFFWLWRSLPRFGPAEVSVRVDDWRDYRRHLDAVGGFFWRIDRGQSLLEPLRREVMERLRRRRAVAGAETDLIALAASISGLPRQRVEQALAGELRHDPATFTRVTGDLQRLLERL